MRKAFIILAIIFIAVHANGQKIDDADVPMAVKMTFSTKYPSYNVERWGNNIYGYFAVFNLNDEDNNVVYVTINPTGEWVETQTQIDTTQLPRISFDYIKKNYPDKKITEAYRIDHSMGPVTFEAIINGYMMLLFNSNGVCMASERKIR